MAEADGDTTTWILLRDAKALVINAYGSSELAEKLLVEWLGEGRVRWTCRYLKGDHSTGDRRFWLQILNINWEEGSALDVCMIEGPGPASSAYGILVSREDTLALLPGEPSEELVASGRWIAAEAKRMKAADEIPQDIGITDLARELAQRMNKAAKTDPSIRPIKYVSIKNKLHEWGLWPVTSIK
jgi:hypothetical protein